METKPVAKKPQPDGSYHCEGCKFSWCCGPTCACSIPSKISYESSRKK